jgi:hypothetical protein
MSLAAPSRQEIVTKINNYLQTNGNITAIEHKEIELLLVDAIYGGQIGDIKEIACDINYINTNFKTGTSFLDEGLGLPTGERYGWAICNGKNGTIDKRGRVGVGYNPTDVDFSTLGYTGGAKTHTLSVTEIPPHNHTITKSTNDVDGNTFSPGSGTGGVTNSSTTGGGQSHNNMQPYIVTLFIQRIPTP